MEIPSGSIFNYQESCEELRQKLFATTVELERTRNVKMELVNLLKMAYQERDEARQELQKLVAKLAPPTLFDVQPTCMMTFPATTTTKANSSITESNSTSHVDVSSPVDSLLEAMSPPEFSNIVDSHNMVYLKQQPLVQNNNNNNNVGVSLWRTCDFGDEVIEFLIEGKSLPQKGNLLKAVMDAGPLLQTLLVAGPLPTWRNPPSLNNIHIPPLLNLGEFASSNININNVENNNVENLFQKPMLNVSGLTNSSFQMMPSNAATCKNLVVPSRIPQSHHQNLLRN